MSIDSCQKQCYTRLILQCSFDKCRCYFKCSCCDVLSVVRILLYCMQEINDKKCDAQIMTENNTCTYIMFDLLTDRRSELHCRLQQTLPLVTRPDTGLAQRNASPRRY